MSDVTGSEFVPALSWTLEQQQVFWIVKKLTWISCQNWASTMFFYDVSALRISGSKNQKSLFIFRFYKKPAISSNIVGLKGSARKYSKKSQRSLNCFEENNHLWGCFSCPCIENKQKNIRNLVVFRV